MDSCLIPNVVKTDDRNYVITSSEIAANMHRSGTHFMAKEYAFIDGTKSTCAECTELSLSVYHPLLRRTIKLCSMLCSGENAENVKTLVSCMDDVAKTATGTNFDPIGFVSDEGGAIQKGLVEFYGHAVKARMKACDFHFYQDRNRYARYCTSSAAKDRFKELTERWKSAVTPANYRKALDELNKFITEKPEKRGPIKGFVKFWDNRKVRFACCYKPLFNVPGASKGETVNAVAVNAGCKSLALVDAVLQDVASSILLRKEYERQQQNLRTVGRGPTAAELDAREEQCQAARAEYGASSLFELDNMTDDLLEQIETRDEAIERYAVDPQSSHRSDRRTTKRTVVDSETSSDDELVAKRSKKQSNSRAAPLRRTRSIPFNESMEKALSENMQVKNYEKGQLHVSMEVITNSHSLFCLKICKSPSCSCPYKINKPREVCKHIIWVLLNLLGLHQEDILLHQIALTEAELSSLLTKAPDNLPEKFKERPENSSSATWHLRRKPIGKDAHCPSCFKTISERELHIEATALWKPRDKDTYINRNFRFCINKDCVQKKPQRSQLSPWNGAELTLPWTLKLSDEDVKKVEAAGFKLKLKIKNV